MKLPWPRILALCLAAGIGAQEPVGAAPAPSDRAPNALSCSLLYSYNTYFHSDYFPPFALGYQRMFGGLGLDISLQKSMGEFEDDDPGLYPDSWEIGGYVEMVGYFLRVKPIVAIARKGYTKRTGSMVYAFGELGLFAQSHLEKTEEGHKSDFPFLGFRPFDIGFGAGGEFNFLYLITPFIETSWHLSLPYEGNMEDYRRHWNDIPRFWPELEAGMRFRF